MDKSITARLSLFICVVYLLPAFFFLNESLPYIGKYYRNCGSTLSFIQIEDKSICPLELVRPLAPFFLLLALGYIILMSYLYLINYIKFYDQEIDFSTKFSIRDITSSGFSRTNLVSSSKGKFTINDIKKIQIINTTPFGPKRRNINEINWREHIVFCVNINNQELSVRFPLFLYPKVKEILLNIIKIKPEIPIEFHQNSGIENLKEGGMI